MKLGRENEERRWKMGNGIVLMIAMMMMLIMMIMLKGEQVRAEDSGTELECLEKSLEGLTLYQKGSKEYASTIAIDNVRVIKEPLGVLMITAESEVQRGIQGVREGAEQ